MGKSELEKMHTCELYLPGDEDIAREQIKCLDRLYDFNMTRPTGDGQASADAQGDV